MMLANATLGRVVCETRDGTMTCGSSPKVTILTQNRKSFRNPESAAVFHS